jgi:hypothetical protein
MFGGALDCARYVFGVVGSNNGGRDNGDVEIVGLDPAYVVEWG